ncbi:lytic transglycosylase domain-containing protein [Alsobacter sp. R-9]
MTTHRTVKACLAGLAASAALCAQAKAEVEPNQFNWHLSGAAPAAKADTATTASIAAPAAKAGEAGLRFDGERRGAVRGLIAKHAAAQGIPVALADAVVRIESRYNPSARNGGAVGLMQIKPQTARGLGYQGGAGGLMNPETNVKYGMIYLAQAYRMSGGDTCTTLMRYQSGHYATRANKANRAYCAKARTIMASN